MKHLALVLLVLASACSSPADTVEPGETAEEESVTPAPVEAPVIEAPVVEAPVVEAPVVAPLAPTFDGFACENPTLGRCTQYGAASDTLGEAGGPEAMAAICRTQGGVWHAGGCRSIGVLGQCVTERATIMCLTTACVSTYSGEACHGAWTASAP